jgi:hypothetical protein
VFPVIMATHLHWLSYPYPRIYPSGKALSVSLNGDKKLIAIFAQWVNLISTPLNRGFFCAAIL